MNKKTLVLGLGVSGIAAAEFLLEKGKAVIGVDSNQKYLKENEKLRQLQEKGLQCRWESELIDFSEIEQLIVSPGVPQTHALYQEAKKRGVSILGEAELALPYFDKPLVAVTGTNGKTTVSYLVSHILNASGIKTKALGNIGTALCSYLKHPDDTQAFVVELSSFQLETMVTPVFDAAVVLNVTPDHLDRYVNMQEYARAKFRLQSLMKNQAKLFIQWDAAQTFHEMLALQNFETFSVDQSCDLFTNKLSVIYHNHALCTLPTLFSQTGRHDLENILAAWILCRPFKISDEQFCQALATFQKPPHRIQFIREINGVCFYDDSKGTNIDAVVQAVNMMKGSVILIVGGLDKGSSYLPWKEHFHGKVKKIIALGQAAPKICDELHPYFIIKRVDTLNSAVEAAFSEAVRGDTVLLSPGCSSQDMFRNYVHRGEEFQRYVKNIEERRDP